ncbi:MAG: fibrinogen-like YCDxxxxGGGW domain-containing protein [Candidatus Saccharimonadales bacterium]
MNKLKAFTPTSLKLRRVKLALPAFTIVELLVVIVVIGILATITIVSYNGITNKAIASSLQSDLANAKAQLNMFQLINSAYPSTISTDCVANPTTIVQPTNLCLKISPGNLYAYYESNNQTNPQIFSLYLSGPNGNTYRISNDSAPVTVSQYRTSCLAILNANEASTSGLYLIKPSDSVISAYCDMSSDGGGWTKIYEGLATSATSVTRTDGKIVEISDGINFNNMKIQAKNWNFSRIGITTETAVLINTFSWYFEWLHDQPDSPSPNVKFHGIDGVQDVQFTVLGSMLSGYGNLWRHLINGQYNTEDADSSMYLGGLPASIDYGDWGYGKYNQHMNDDYPVESGLGLTPRKFQEIYVWVK